MWSLPSPGAPGSVRAAGLEHHRGPVRADPGVRSAPAGAPVVVRSTQGGRAGGEVAHVHVQRLAGDAGHEVRRDAREGHATPRRVDAGVEGVAVRRRHAVGRDAHERVRRRTRRRGRAPGPRIRTGRSGLPSAGAAVAKTTIRPSSLVTCRRPRLALPAPLIRGGAPNGCEMFANPPIDASQTCLVAPSDPGRLVVRCMSKTTQDCRRATSAPLDVAVAGGHQEDLRGRRSCEARCRRDRWRRRCRPGPAPWACASTAPSAVCGTPFSTGRGKNGPSAPRRRAGARPPC